MFYPKSTPSKIWKWVKAQSQKNSRESRRNTQLLLRIEALALLTFSAPSLWAQPMNCVFNEGASTTVSEDFNTSAPPYTTSYTASYTTSISTCCGLNIFIKSYLR